jgi:thiamine-phosphate pyrophosphorylase
MDGHKADLYLRLDAASLSVPGGLDALVAAARPAALLITEATGARQESVRALVESAKRLNLAVLIADDIDLAAALGADGVHIAADQPRLAAARARLGADKTVGVSCGPSRHEAMTMGEGGADYIAFGEHWGGKPRDAEVLAGMVGWWGAIFELPCVAWLGDEDTASDAAALAGAGADFIAVRCGARSPAEDRERLGDVHAGLTRGR